MLEKFLIEFGPCRHGKFMETTYQETHIFDIISHVDALRHAISTGDRVIAPIQADGDKYAPGVVIRGQERRSAEGQWNGSVVWFWKCGNIDNYGL